MNNEIIKYKEIINEKDKEIKDFQIKIKILLNHVKEKNNYVRILENIIQNNENYNSSINSDKDIENTYFDCCKLLKKYKQLKKDFEELKKENDILYKNINNLTIEKNDLNRILNDKNEEYKNLKFEYYKIIDEINIIKKQEY